MKLLGFNIQNRASVSVSYLTFLIVSLLQISAFAGESVFKNFVHVNGDRIFDGDMPVRFISFNIPNLLLIEDNMPFTQKNAWRLPDAVTE